MKQFFEFVLRSLGRHMGWLIAPLAAFPWLPAFFQNTMGQMDDRAGYATFTLVLYGFAALALVTKGESLGWFDRRPWRAAAFLVMIGVGLIVPMVALACMYLDLDKSWYLTLRLWLSGLIPVAVVFIIVDKVDYRYERKKLAALLSNT